jgi:hypothetical protein
MSKPDAERALKIYRLFVKQTDLVVRYLSIARHYEHATRLEIPKIKHAPTGLSNSLEEYVKDSDFEINRRQYLAQQDAKKNGKTGASSSATKKADTNGAAAKPAATPVAAKEPTKGPAPDLIDFFASIEQNQQPMVQQTFQQGQIPQQMTVQQYQTNPFLQQPTGMQQQQMPPNMQQPLQNTNPFLQMGQPTPPVQQDFTGNPMGFAPQFQQQQQQQPGPARFQPTLQSVPQSAAAQFQPTVQQPFQTGSPNLSLPASTNPFRQSMIANNTTGSTNTSFTSAPSAFSSQPTGGNPFTRPQSIASPTSSFGGPSPFGQSSPFSPGASSTLSTPPALMPQATGTNPFAKAVAPSSNPFGAAPVTSNPTGSTNPFRQSQFVNQSTGSGWQNSAGQGTIGGFQGTQLDTVPVFPRPGMNSQ